MPLRGDEPKPRWDAQRIVTYALWDIIALLAIVALVSLATWLVADLLVKLTHYRRASILDTRRPSAG